MVTNRIEEVCNLTRKILIENYTMEDIESLIRILYPEDNAHGIDHIYNVLENALIINEHEELYIPGRLIIIASVFHDCGNIEDRKKHEVIGSEFLYDILTRIGLSNNIKVMLRDAVLFHRASFKGEFGDNKLAELLSSADRGKPDNLEDLISRSKKYAMKELNMNEEDAQKHAIAHMHEKYGRNGYAKLPDIYINYYKEEVESLWNAIDNLK